MFVDHSVLMELHEPEFRETLARFSMAFADALDPEQQAKRLLEIVEQRFLSPGSFALRVWGGTREMDLTLECEA